VLGVREGSNVVAVALVTLPGEHASPPELAAHRERLWKELGDRARQRYEAFATARHQLAVPCAHYHLNMIGVRRSHAGRGLARRLLDVVHAMSARDAESGGVTLTTEDANNVPLYEHFGYRIVDHVCIAPELESWGFFRADATPV